MSDSPTVRIKSEECVQLSFTMSLFTTLRCMDKVECGEWAVEELTFYPENLKYKEVNKRAFFIGGRGTLNSMLT